MNSPRAFLPGNSGALNRIGSLAASVVATAILLISAFVSSGAASGCGILQIKDGYFWDPALRSYFIPRGFAYQTFNPPVGANQSPEQLAYDFTEFKKLHANSARVEMVWNQIETSPGVYDWSKADFLVAKADELGMRLFVLIGFQYAPTWFPREWTATNDVGEGSVVVNYEHPEARRAYSNYVYQVAHHYRDRNAIGAWILGNEYAYFDLWNTNRHFLGYDPISQNSFRSYLASVYATNITLLNSNWGKTFTSFNSVVMPTLYPRDRNDPGYFDLIQWRKKSIGDYVAVGAVAALRADTNHLLTYSMVGGVFSGFDELNTCEDAKTIVARCAAAGAPLSFWSVNNYALASLGSELRAADFGIAKYQAQSGLPVLVTETGHSSTDDLNPEELVRHAKALPTQMWEALVSGALGVHVFTWNDRDLFAGPFLREKGFGVVNQDRTPKQPVYENVARAFLRMENLNLPVLLGGSTNPPPDIQYFWSRNADMVWPRANLENALTWGALKRLGYEPGIIDDEQFAAGAATNARALLLSRCWMMEPSQLDRVATNIVPAGVHIHANADLPGEYSPYHVRNPNWTSQMNTLFGLNVAQATPGLDSGITNVTFGRLDLSGVTNFGQFSPSYADQILTWKLWHRIPTNSGTMVRHTGLNGTQPSIPALQVKDLGTARAAVNTFALGDIENSQPSTPLQHKWDFRYTWLRAIYRDYFLIPQKIELTGPGSSYVFPDHRFCRNGSVLIGLLNGDTNTASLTLTATSLLRGKTVENLTNPGILEPNSDGTVNLTLGGDEYVLLYAYASAGGLDQSLINTNSNKLWVGDAPAAVWPTGSNWLLSVGYDVRDPQLTLMGSLERVLSPNLVYARATAQAISGRGTAAVPLSIPDADLNDPWYISSLDGGEYVFHAWLTRNGTSIADTYLPIRLLWPVRPINLPATVVAGRSYEIIVEWQDLPSWLPSEGSAPLNRAPLWQPYLASQQYYKVVLELRSAGQVIATQEFLTNAGTDWHTFNMPVPPNALGPFTWTAYLRTAPNASVDLLDSFEDRASGEGTDLYAPWVMQTYPDGAQIWQNAGVGAGAASDGTQSVFMVLTNPPNPQGFSGCFLYYTYPRPWALPRDMSQWTNYIFSFDFMEARGRACVLEMQLKDDREGVINFTKTYTPSAGWDRVRASLDQFTVPSWLGHFDPEKVTQLLVNIQLLETNVQYLGYLDNVRFTAPLRGAPTTSPEEIWDSFDDRSPGNELAGWSTLSPWGTYVYPPSSTREFDRGVVLHQGIIGGQAGMMVVTNPAGLGPISAFGLYRRFTNSWSLPANTSAWTNYVFSYSFREANYRPCRIEMQVKSDTNKWIEFGRTYTPGPGGWDTLRASLAEFVQPVGVGPFDRTHLTEIALNVRVSSPNTTYVGFFENVCFDTPDTLLPSGSRFGLYTSSNDVPPDTTLLRIGAIQVEPVGEVILSWLARSNRVYCVEAQDCPISQDNFQPVEGLTQLTRLTDGVLSAVDTNAPTSAGRFYRVRMQPR